MSNTDRDNVMTRSDSERNENSSSRPAQPLDNSTIIRRTLVEHGIRPVRDENLVNTHLSTTNAITTIAKQHQDEQRELQELNTKFSIYLDRVHYLENRNHQLATNLTSLKQTWGGDAAQLHAAYNPQLFALRDEINNAIRDQALQELLLKRHEYDLWQIQQQIATFEDNGDYNRLNRLKQELDASNIELEHLKSHFDQRLSELARQRHIMEEVVKELNNLKNELDNHQLERIVIENELQTLREHAAFHDAIYRAQRDELVTLGTPSLDVSGFYRAELAHAIADIRHDFEILSQSQVNELEEYYRVKTEQVREEIERENERKRLLASEGVIESMDKTDLTTSLRTDQNDLLSLQVENKQLQAQFDAIIEDLDRIQNENAREKYSYEQDLLQLRQLIEEKQDTVDNLVENNVSLRFELSTYGRLLSVEEQHLNRMEQHEQQQQQQQQLQNSAAVPTPSNQNQQAPSRVPSDLTTKKMTVQKTARGPISFESVDLELDCAILVNEKFSGSEQLFRNWSIRREVDQESEILYKFPSTFSLRPRQTIRIFAKQSPHAARSIGDTLIADKIDTWGIGRKMITRLIDDNNEEKAIITQVFQ